jgi:hypothetical protein
MTETTSAIANKLLEKEPVVSSMEVSAALLETLPLELDKCAKNGIEALPGVDYFSIIQIMMSDINNPYVMKRLFMYYPFLPKPKPDMAVWEFCAKDGSLNFLWSLPDPFTCVYASYLVGVGKEWQSTARWCRDFYDGTLIDNVRKEKKIHLKTQEEYLKEVQEKGLTPEDLYGPVDQSP